MTRVEMCSGLKMWGELILIGGQSCATDASGNIIVTCVFRSTNLTLGAITLTNAGDFDMFIVKLGDGFGLGIDGPPSDGENTVNIYPNPFSSQAALQTNSILLDATITLSNC